jgi:hypothetical protein
MKLDRAFKSYNRNKWYEHYFLMMQINVPIPWLWWNQFDLCPLLYLDYWLCHLLTKLLIVRANWVTLHQKWLFVLDQNLEITEWQTKTLSSTVPSINPSNKSSISSLSIEGVSGLSGSTNQPANNVLERYALFYLPNKLISSRKSSRKFDEATK